MIVEALLSPTEFEGLEGVVHLCTGGEAPWLKSQKEAYGEFARCKSGGVEGRRRIFDRVAACRLKMASLWDVPAARIGFMLSAAEGMNWLARGLEWRPGDNVVTTGVEFPSVAYAWRSVESSGVDIRMVPHRNWLVDEGDLVDAMDSKTRVVAISQVSFYSGQCLDVARLSESARKNGALLAVDATHASGVVPVLASATDLCITSCYKWMLATHGVAPCYLSPQAEAASQVSSFGWHNLDVWQGETYECRPDVALKPMPDLLEPGNPSLVSIMFLERALDVLLGLGIERIQSHARLLSTRAFDGLKRIGRTLISPVEVQRRSGNTSFAAENAEALVTQLAKKQILLWGEMGRVRISTHVHNCSDDVDRCISALQQIG